jgi:DNA polymerase epsilon subunit 1
MPPRRAGQPFRRVGKQGNTSYGPRKPKTVDASSLRSTEATSQNEKLESNRLANRIDEAMGFPRFDSGKKKVGWLVNMHSTTIEDENVPGGKAGVDYYFLGENGDTFKATLEYDPYFLVAVKRGREQEVEEFFRRAYEGLIKNIKRVEKEDLSMPNHLTGYRRTFLQLSFANVNDLLAVRKTINPIVEKNKKNINALDTYAEVAR